jgi:4-hydroxybenzoate polyprenyltransferase
MTASGGELRDGRAAAHPHSGCGRASLVAMVGTTRPLSSLVVGTLTLAAAAAGRDGFTLRSAVAGLAMTALAAFGFAVNDIFDYQKDRAAGVGRPVATGALSREGAAWLAAAMLLIAGLLSVAIRSGRAVGSTTAALLFLYSPAAKRFPLWKDVYMAVLCCAPLWYGGTVGGAQFPWTSYAALACFVFGREVLMDSDELPGDSRAGMRTIAAVLGTRRTAGIGQAVMLLAAGSLAALVHGRMAISAAALTLVSLLAIFGWPGLDLTRRIGLSRLPMMLGSVALACGGI